MNVELARMVDYIRTTQKRFKSFDTFNEFTKIMESLGIKTTKKGFISQSKRLTQEEIKGVTELYKAIRGAGGTRKIEKHIEERMTIRDYMDKGREGMKELYARKSHRKVYQTQKRLRKTAISLIQKSNLDITKMSDDFIDLYAFTIGQKFEDLKKKKEEYACDVIVEEMENELSDFFSSEDEQVTLQSDYLSNVYDYLSEESDIKKYSSFDFD